MRDFHVRALELQAVLAHETPVELLHPDLLIEIVVAAIQSQSSAFMHGRTSRTEAPIEDVVRHLEDIAGNTVDWNAKLHDAADAEAIAIEGSNARIL